MQLNYTTNAMEDAILAAAVAELNAQPNSGGPPAPDTAWTPQTFTAAFGTAEFIRGQGQRFQTQLLGAAIAAFPTASVPNQTIVLNKLGLTAYAALSPEALLPIFQALGMPAFLALKPTDQAAV